DTLAPVKAVGEIIHQGLGSGVAVRLEDRPDAVCALQAGRLDRGANFRGVMAIVIYHRHAVPLRLDLKTPIRAPEMLQPFAKLLRTEAELQTHGHRRERVLDVMATWNIQSQAAQGHVPH